MRVTLAAIAAAILTACASSTTPIPSAWLHVEQAKDIDPKEVCAQVHCRERNAQDVRVDGGKLVRGDKSLTPQFKGIDSFDVSAERKEVVFSAKREDNYDVGLVSIDGSDVHWVPGDPSDEVGVQWSSRVNMVSYLMRRPTGDSVRVVHVSLGVQFVQHFAYSAVRGVLWEGERMHVVVSPVDASPRVESMKFNGEERRLDTPSATSLSVDSEPIAGGVILRPKEIRYSEKLPLVVWVASDFGWSDARASLIRNARVACAVVMHEPDAAFWTAIEATPWVDAQNVFVVGARGTRSGTTYIASASGLDGVYRRDGNAVLVPPAVVQSVTVGFIADQLKGANKRNGRNR